MTRRLAICADGFGRAPSRSEAIAGLSRRGRLSAVSCVTSLSDWQTSAALLREVPTSVERGLHFNLTEGRPLSRELLRVWGRFPTLPKLIARAHLSALPRAALRSEFDAQFDAFVAATGAPPRFVDGHQHVHHLPVVRNVVLDALARCPTQVAVRNTGFVVGPGIERRRIVIERTGGRALLRRLRERGIAHNASLNGLYDRRASDYRSLMRHWLATVPDQGALLVCEPDADTAPGTADPAGAARARERFYLESADFDADLRVFDVVLAPVWRVGAWW
ncbi:MAG: ChbG/HpnK family deacetylase [Caldimonas sp.]